MQSAKRYISIVLALSLTAFVAGCGGDKDNSSKPSASTDGAPSIEQLITKALSNERPQSEGGEAKIDLSVKAESEDPQLAFLKEGISWSGKGYADQGFVDFKSNLKLGAQALAFDILADKKQSFIKLGQSWYGPNPGMDDTDSKQADDLTKQLGLSGVPTDPAQAKKELEKLKQYADKYGSELFVGSVVKGPQVDGQDTWRFNGKIDTDALVKMVQEIEAEENKDKKSQSDSPAGVVPSEPSKTTVTDKDKEMLRQLLDLLDISLTFGKDDGYVHGVGFKFSATKEQLSSIEKMDKTSTPSTSLPESIELSFDAMTTSLKVRENATLTPPTGDIKSPEKLSQDLQTQIGALFLLGGMSMDEGNNQDPTIDPDVLSEESMSGQEQAPEMNIPEEAVGLQSGS